MRRFRYSEGDSDQVEFLPASHEQEIARVFSGERGTAPEASPPEPLSSLRMAVDDVSAILSPTLPAFDQVIERVTGGDGEPRDDLTAFGLDDGTTIFFEKTASGLVESMWLSLSMAEEEELETLLHATRQLGERWPLLLVDYSWEAIALLRDHKALRQYIFRFAWGD